MRTTTDRKISISFIAGLFVIQALLVFPVLSSDEAAAAPPSPTSWTRYAGNPLVRKEGGSELYGASLVDTGAEFFFYYSSNGIRLATSSDCKSWTKYAGNPIWTSGCNPSVIKDGATFKMWYTDPSGVCYATSTDGKVWTTQATGLMAYGGSGAWDNQIWRVNVIKDTDGYKMYYEGRLTKSQIGYATSPDETHWTKYQGNPIMKNGPSGSYDAHSVQFPWVMKLSGEYRMWFSGFDGSRVAICYANSSDGISWTKYANNPVLGYNNGWDSYSTMPTIVLRNNTLEMMYTGITSSWSYEAGLAESFGSTPGYPELLSPLDDQWTNDSTPRFGWRFGTPNEQTSFQLQLDDDPAFSPALYDSGKLAGNGTTFDFPSTLADGTYYWRVKSWDLVDAGSSLSPAWKFKIDSSPPLNPTGLASGSHAVGVWSNDNTVDANWSLPAGGGDNSGYAGFATAWDTSQTTVPVILNVMDAGVRTSTSDAVGETDRLYFHIRAKDRAGNWADGAVHLGPFAVDSTPPQNPANVFSPTHIPQVWTSLNTMDMTWPEPAAGISGADGYSYLWDRVSYTLPQTVLNITADVRNVSSLPLADGLDWYFHLRTKDRAGNWALSAVHSGPYRIDSTPPSVFSLLINGGAEYAGCMTVRAIVRAEDGPGGSGLSEMRWRLQDDGWGPWAPYADSSFLELSRGDDLYSIRLQVRDLANNTGPEANASIRLDRQDPSASLKLNGGAAFTNGAAVQVELSGSDPEPGSGLWNMSLSNDGKDWGPWLPFCATCTHRLASGDGQKTVYLRLRDRAGNVGPASNASIVYDTVAPVSFMPMLAAVVDDLVFDVCWTAADATSGVAAFFVQYMDANGTWTDWMAGTCQTSARFTGLDGHNYRFRALAVDRAGNREATYKEASGTVRIELPPPFLAVARPAANSTVTGRFAVSGTAGHPRADRGVVLVEVRIDNGDWKPARGNLTWSFSYDSTKLANGRHTLHVRAFDGTRYSAEETRQIEVKNEPPLTVGGIPVLVLAVVVILMAAAAGAIAMVSRRKEAPLRPAPPAPLNVPPPAPPMTPYPQAPQPWAPPVPPPLPMVYSTPEPALATSPADMPAPPPRPRTAEQEQSMREAKVLKALSSLPRGLPSSLWGLEMEDLSSKVVRGERKITDNGDVIVKINNRWYYGDETDLGLFMQHYKEG
jgi:hypothetical protein